MTSQVIVNDRTVQALEEMLAVTHQVCILDFAQVMRANVAERSPYEKGHNRDSIRLDPINPGPTDMVIRIVTESGYGGWLEVGTGKMDARPYFGPGFEETRSMFGV